MPRLITSRVSERRSRHVKDPDSRTDCTLGCSVRFWGRDAWGARVRTLDRDVSAGVSVRSSGPSESFREPLGAGCANFDPMAEIRLGVEGFILRTAVSKGDAGAVTRRYLSGPPALSVPPLSSAWRPSAADRRCRSCRVTILRVSSRTRMFLTPPFRARPAIKHRLDVLALTTPATPT